MSTFLNGRDCQLGYGFDRQMNYIQPIQNMPQFVGQAEKTGALTCISQVSAEELSLQPELGQLLSQKCLKKLDNQLVFDGQQYYMFSLAAYRRQEWCQQCDWYANNTPEFVYGIIYGIHVYVVVSKSGLPADQNAALRLFSSQTGKDLTDNILDKECQVMKNFGESKKSTLRAAFKYMDGFAAGKHDRVIPVIALTKQKPVSGVGALSLIYVAQAELTRDFMGYLYACVRKIEVTLAKNDCAECILTDPEYDNLSVNDKFNKLKMAQNAYEKMNKTDFFKMYPIMMQLFFVNQAAVRYLIFNRKPIIEDVVQPKDIEQLKKWLVQLNNWTPVKIGNEYYQKSDCILKCPANSEFLRMQFKKSGDSVKITVDSSITEPQIKLANGSVFHLLGFADMSDAVTDHDNIVENNDEILKKPCSKHSPDIVRVWMCKECGHFVRINVRKNLSIHCECGVKEFREKLFTCVNLDCHSDDEKVNPVNQRYRDENVANSNPGADIADVTHTSLDMSDLPENVKRLFVRIRTQVLETARKQKEAELAAARAEKGPRLKGIVKAAIVHHHSGSVGESSPTPSTAAVAMEHPKVQGSKKVERKPEAQLQPPPTLPKTESKTSSSNSSKRLDKKREKAHHRHVSPRPAGMAQAHPLVPGHCDHAHQDSGLHNTQQDRSFVDSLSTGLLPNDWQAEQPQYNNGETLLDCLRRQQENANSGGLLQHLQQQLQQQQMMQQQHHQLQQELQAQRLLQQQQQMGGYQQFQPCQSDNQSDQELDDDGWESFILRNNL